jgi:hypothetical protein
LVAAAYYSNGTPHNFRKIAPDGTQTQYTSISGKLDEVKVVTARSPALGGYAGSPFAPGTMFAGNGGLSQIIRINPDGTVVGSGGIWSTMPTGTGAGRFWGLHVDRTGVFGGDLIAATSTGNVYRINGAGAATQLGATGALLQGLMTVPNDPLVYGGMAGKILIGSESNNRIYWFDAAGNSGFWSAPAPIDDLEMIVPNENFYGVNYAGGRILAASAAQFQAQGLVGKILASQEFVSLHALSWNFSTNAPQFAQITTAAGSLVSNHWEDVAFAPAGVMEMRTTLPRSDEYRISGAMGMVDDLGSVPIPATGTGITHYNYNSTTHSGTPPEARANKGVMTVVEDYRGIPYLMIVLDKSGDATGGSLRLQLTGHGSDLATTYPNVQDDPTGDSFTYSAGTGFFDWSWTAGQTDGVMVQLPYPRLASDPLAPWSITFSTLAMSGLDGFVFLADGREIDLGTAGFNFTLSIPLAGDLNNDGTVNAADFIVWRKGLGTIYTQEHYNEWRANFGRTVSGAASGENLAAVPEPAAAALFLAAMTAMILRRPPDAP